MSNVPLKDLKYSRFYVRSVYCSWKKIFRFKSKWLRDCPSNRDSWKMALYATRIRDLRE